MLGNVAGACRSGVRSLALAGGALQQAGLPVHALGSGTQYLFAAESRQPCGGVAPASPMGRLPAACTRGTTVSEQ